MAMGLQQGLALACFDCAVTPLRATEQRPEEGDVQKVLLRCLEMAPEEAKEAIEAAEARKQDSLTADLARRRRWAESGGHPAYPKSAFRDEEQWAEWSEVESSVCSRVQRRMALHDAGRGTTGGASGQRVAFAGGTLMVSVQDVNAEIPVEHANKPLRLRVSCEGTAKTTEPLRLGGQEGDGPMLGFPVTSLDADVEVAVCVCRPEEYTPGGDANDADSLAPVALSAPIPVRDLAGAGGENDLWCQLAKAEIGGREKMKNLMMRKSTGKSAKASSAAGRIHLKMRFVAADGPDSSISDGNAAQETYSSGGSSTDPFQQMAALQLLLVRDYLTEPANVTTRAQGQSLEQEDFPVVGHAAAWLLAEFGYRFGVRRPHQRLLHLEAVGNVAREEGPSVGPRHACTLYRLLCAAQAETFLTKTEEEKHRQIVSGLSALARTWALDFRCPIPRYPAHAPVLESGEGVAIDQGLCDAGELTTAVVEIVLLSADEPFEEVCSHLTRCVQGAASRCYNRLVRELNEPGLTVQTLGLLVEAVNDEIVADEECYSVAFPSEVPLQQTTKSTLFNHLMEDTRSTIWKTTDAGVLAPAVTEDSASAAVKLLLALRAMCMQADGRAERHKLMHALAELFSPVLDSWVAGAEKTLARLLETTVAIGNSTSSQELEDDIESLASQSAAALETLQGGCLKAMRYLDRIGDELLPRSVCVRLLRCVGETYAKYAELRAAAATEVERDSEQVSTGNGHNTLRRLSSSDRDHVDGASSTANVSPAADDRTASAYASAVRMRSFRTAALKAMDGARAAMDSALIDLQAGFESSLPRPTTDAEGWAAAVSLLNDTVGSAESLAEIVPEMERLCAHCRESWLASNRPAASQICTVYEVVHWVPGDEQPCSEAPSWHVSADSLKAGVAATSTGDGSNQVAHSLDSLSAGGDQNEWEWRGEWEIGSDTPVATRGPANACGNWEWEIVSGSSLTSSMGTESNWTADLKLLIGDNDDSQVVSESRRRRRRAWQRKRVATPDAAAMLEAKQATSAVTKALTSAFTAIRSAVDDASAAPRAALLASLEPEWAAVLVASVPLSADDQAKRSEQRNAAAAAIAGLHDALVAAKAGPLLGSLSDGAASYTITRVWEALLERLEYSMYNGQPHTEASIKGQRSPPRDLPASQLSAAVSRAGEIMSAAASTTSDGAAAVAAATEKMLCLCTLANETTPALLDRYTSGGDAVLSRQRSSNGSAETFHGRNIELSVLVHESLQAIGLLSGRRSDKEAQSFVRQELDDDIFRENESLRSRHGLHRREVIISSYRCLSAQAVPGSLTLTTTHIIFEPTQAQALQQPGGQAVGRSGGAPASPTKRTSLPLAEIARAEKFSGRLTKLDNALRLEMMSSESVIFLEVQRRDELLADVAAQARRYPETIRVETPDVDPDGAVKAGALKAGMLKSLAGAKTGLGGKWGLGGLGRSKQ